METSRLHFIYLCIFSTWPKAWFMVGLEKVFIEKNEGLNEAQALKMSTPTFPVTDRIGPKCLVRGMILSFFHFPCTSFPEKGGPFSSLASMLDPLNKHRTAIINLLAPIKELFSEIYFLTTGAMSLEPPPPSPLLSYAAWPLLSCSVGRH